VLAASFIFIFVLLQMETYALVTGSVVLFIILALIMYLTRKINWYNE
jgi:inner membrane protein